MNGMNMMPNGFTQPQIPANKAETVNDAAKLNNFKKPENALENRFDANNAFKKIQSSTQNLPKVAKVAEASIENLKNATEEEKQQNWNVAKLRNLEPFQLEKTLFNIN